MGSLEQEVLPHQHPANLQMGSNMAHRRQAWMRCCDRFEIGARVTVAHDRLVAVGPRRASQMDVLVGRLKEEREGK